MKMVLAPDSFKGSLTSGQVIERIRAAAVKHFPDCEIVSFPIADGGEGTVDALLRAAGGQARYQEVQGPLGESVKAKYGIIKEDTAVIEMASACGLPLVPPEKRDICRASSYGTGELIRKVLKDGYREIIIAVGGSVTNDGGIGALAALGMEFLDEKGNVLEPVGGNLARIADYRTEGICPELADTHITVMCDVENPLLGKCGATYMYGPQKGGTKETLDYLERGMKNYADVILQKTGVSYHNMKGAGAAGGITVSLMAFAGARLKSGISVVLELGQFERRVEDADLVVTGEGHLDAQSLYGKVVYGVGMACKRYRIPAIALVGGVSEEAKPIYDCGIASVMPIVNGVMDMGYAIENAEKLLEDAADRMFRFIKAGMCLRAVD